jgi:hypothetical protein
VAVALKGQNKCRQSSHCIHLLCPFRATVDSLFANPGRCPGLSYCRPSGGRFVGWVELCEAHADCRLTFWVGLPGAPGFDSPYELSSPGREAPSVRVTKNLYLNSARRSEFDNPYFGVFQRFQLLERRAHNLEKSGCNSPACEPQGKTALEASRDQDTVAVGIGKQQAIFRKISPDVYKIDYPEFYLLETEVTNRMYREYLRATGKVSGSCWMSKRILA